MSRAVSGTSMLFSNLKLTLRETHMILSSSRILPKQQFKIKSIFRLWRGRMKTEADSEAKGTITNGITRKHTKIF